MTGVQLATEHAEGLADHVANVAVYARTSPEQKLEKLETVLELSKRPIEKDLPAIAGLLSVPTGERYPTLEDSPERQRERLLSALVEQVSALAEIRPVLHVLDE